MSVSPQSTPAHTMGIESRPRGELPIAVRTSGWNRSNAGCVDFSACEDGLARGEPVRSYEPCPCAYAPAALEGGGHGLNLLRPALVAQAEQCGVALEHVQLLVQQQLTQLCRGERLAHGGCGIHRQIRRSSPLRLRCDGSRHTPHTHVRRLSLCVMRRQVQPQNKDWNAATRRLFPFISALLCHVGGGARACCPHLTHCRTPPVPTCAPWPTRQPHAPPLSPPLAAPRPRRPL
jgi:hypothetical protein